MSDCFGANSYCCAPEHVIDCVNPNVAQIFVENWRVQNQQKTLIDHNSALIL
jgi:hypothetical protein